MEFPELDQRCDRRDCKQLDFLPLKCGCGKIFCSEHFNEHLETCETKISNTVTNLKRIEDSYKCSFENCKSTSIVPLICEGCKKHFCVVHRHIGGVCEPGDPNVIVEARKKIEVPIQKFNDAKDAVDKEVDQQLAKVKKRGKNLQMANKVQLMRMKNKATGSATIPTADRVYFNVKYPRTITDKSQAIFVSKTWTVGRTIDAIAQDFKVPNNNNQADSLKLRLFQADDGRILTNTMSDNVEELLTKEIVTNGQSLILEYVTDECKSVGV